MNTVEADQEMSLQLQEFERGVNIKQELDERQKLSIWEDHKMNIIKCISESKITCIAVVAMLVCFILEMEFTLLSSRGRIFGFFNISINTMIRMGANLTLYVYEGELYRLFTTMFLHSGILHLLLSTASLISFCSGVEAKVSRMIYVVVLIIGGIQGNMLNNFMQINWFNSRFVSFGPSTSLSAVIGLYLSKIFIEFKLKGVVLEKNKQIIKIIIHMIIISWTQGNNFFFGYFGGLFSGFLIGIITQIGKEQTILKRYWNFSVFSYIVFSLILFIPFLK